MYPFTKFLLVSILKIFRFYGVFFCHSIWDYLKFLFGRDFRAEIWYIGLLLHVTCIQLVPLPSLGDTVSTRPSLKQYPLFSYILFLSKDRDVELKRTGPATKVAGLFDKPFSLFR